MEFVSCDQSLFVCQGKLDMPTTSTKQTTYLDSQVELRVPAGIQAFANKTTPIQPREETYGGHLIKLHRFFCSNASNFHQIICRKEVASAEGNTERIFILILSSVSQRFSSSVFTKFICGFKIAMADKDQTKYS